MDKSIAENVAFGLPPEQIDLQQVQKALDQANLREFVQTLKEGIHIELVKEVFNYLVVSVSVSVLQEHCIINKSACI